MVSKKVAIVHDYLIARGGAERVVEEIAKIFPDAPIYTGMYDPKNFRGTALENRKIITGSAVTNGILSAAPKQLTFLMPTVFESFDLSKYDIVISSSSSYAKGVLTKPHQLHICYIHTPPRFLYGYSVESTERNAWYYKPFVSYIDHYLRIWDFLAAQRPDLLITNSQNVRKRIQKFYRRDAAVIYPPISAHPTVSQIEDTFQKPYYIAVGRLSRYKNFDLLVETFNLLDMRLVIVGNGREEKKLRHMAGKNVQIVGNANDQKRDELMTNSLGLIFPVEEEDFGIILVEAIAMGKPVLAHASGGALEIVKDGENGMFFEKANTECLIEKLKDFDQKIRGREFDEAQIKQTALKFTDRDFKKEFEDFVCRNYQK